MELDRTYINKRQWINWEDCIRLESSRENVERKTETDLENSCRGNWKGRKDMGRGEEVCSEKDSLEALCGCPMLLLEDKEDDDDGIDGSSESINSTA